MATKEGTMRLRAIALITILGAFALAGCGDDDGDDDTGASAATEVTATEPPAEPETAPGTTIKTGDSQYGPVLFDGGDRAVYYFDKETSAESQCYGPCAEAWPPVLTEGEPRAGDGARAGRLGTTERTDGTTQVTYDGRPLYYYDEPPGEVTCHDVEEFGGLWLAVQPSGEPVPS